MNERIRTLMEEVVRIEVDPDSGMETIYTCGPEDFEAYAELIVRECMRMCDVTEMSFVTHNCDVEASGAITVKQFIAEHFGVEE
jgi:hypothetical protein